MPSYNNPIGFLFWLVVLLILVVLALKLIAAI